MHFHRGWKDGSVCGNKDLLHAGHEYRMRPLKIIMSDNDYYEEIQPELHV